MFRHCRKRSGLTFIELIVAMTIVALVVGALQVLGEAVHDSFAYNTSHGTAMQHARVALDRISRTASQATASTQFPGFMVLSSLAGSTAYPDTLVVWHPSGTASDPTGLPRFNELVVYCPASNNPDQLQEITVVGDTRVVPLPSATSTWATEIAAIKQSTTNTQVTLTTLLRSCPTSSGAMFGAVRFATRALPSDTQYAQYKAGTLTWKNLPWVQGNCGSTTGLRQVWLRMEIQLMPDPNVLGRDASTEQPVPFYGSVALYYAMGK